MTAILLILSYALLLYIFVLWGRLIFDYVQMFNRQWRPRGGLLVVADAVYTLTDPPIRLVSRVIPPLRVGSVAINFGWTIVLLVAIILRSLLGTIIAATA